ncbi:MAG: hypothetical protein JW969_06620 [Spirochaetales bacterium]|nr:hypothetical protein [Spirochaetales bacterium]
MNISRLALSLIILSLFTAGPAFGQDALAGPGPSGYRNIKLGADLETVKKMLKDDSYFLYRGDPDVSFLPFREQTLIECEGTGYIERAYFQFHENRLFIIILVMNRKKVDYHSLFTALTDKYGPSSSLDPGETVWNFSNVRLSVEKPASVKYIQKDVFEKLKEEGQASESLMELSLKEFLNQF